MALDQPTATIIASFVVGIVAGIGWWVAHYFMSKRDVENERRKLTTQYLIEAYRKLESVSNRSKLDASQTRDIESTIADIQLFGTKVQADLAQELGRGIIQIEKNGGTISSDSLLNDLRNSLRNELGLEPIEGNRFIIRYGRND